MNRYVLTRLAATDIEQIWDYIGIENGNPTAAQNIVESLHQSFVTLASFPYIGVPEEGLSDIVRGIRMFAEPPYKVYYVPRDAEITVVRVVHSRREHHALRFDVDVSEQPERAGSILRRMLRNEGSEPR